MYFFSALFYQYQRLAVKIDSEMTYVLVVALILLNFFALASENVLLHKFISFCQNRRHFTGLDFTLRCSVHTPPFLIMILI